MKQERGFNNSSILKVSRQEALKSGGSLRHARSSLNKRAKSKNSQGEVRKSKAAKLNKSMGEGSLERAINDLSIDRSSCHCSQDKRRSVNLQEGSRNLPNPLKSENSLSNSRLLTNRHIGHGCQDTFSR